MSIAFFFQSIIATVTPSPAFFLLPLLFLLAVSSCSVDFLAVYLPPLLLLRCYYGRRRKQRCQILAAAHLYLFLPLLPSMTAAIPPSTTTGAFLSCFLHGIFLSLLSSGCSPLPRPLSHRNRHRSRSWPSTPLSFSMATSSPGAAIVFIPMEYGLKMLEN